MVKNNPGILFFIILFYLMSNVHINSQTNSDAYKLFPANNISNVNPDTHLEITFTSKPEIGKTGKIRIYDSADDHLVDQLDLSIPAGPTAPTPSPDAIYSPVPYEYLPGHFTNANTKPGTPSGKALPTPDGYQLTIIGGFTDGFHFYPIIIHGNTAIIYLHNNLLEYNKSYYVQIDPGVLTLKDDSFSGIADKDGWRFTTKIASPAGDVKTIIVSTDGAGDFNTVQGAIDFIPDYNPNPVTIFIKNGLYEEIVYFRNKTNITIVGEDRDKVVVQYANNEVFNPHPINLKTNEWPGTFPSRRAAFAVDHCNKINLVNMTIKTTAYGQAEGLLINGEAIIICNVTIVGSGDALQSNGTAYYNNCSIIGDGDTILGRGAAFFNNCELSSYGTFMWIRNTSSNHGNVFLNCKFQTRGSKETELARAPANKGTSYPYCEAVLLNCSLAGISSIGWGPVGGDSSNVHYWEYNSRNIGDGKPTDVSKRHPASHRLTMENDAEIIANYMNPWYVLNGWKPSMVPVIIDQPQSQFAGKGETVVFKVKCAAIPNENYQWFKNGNAIDNANGSALVIEDLKSKDAGEYSVIVKNSSGSVTSDKAILRIK